LTVSITDVVLGTEAEVPILGGSVILKIDAGTQPGKILRLRDKGIKHLNHSGKGDQLVYVNVYIPGKIGSKEKELFKELAKSDAIKPKKNADGKKSAESRQKGFFSKMKDSFS